MLPLQILQTSVQKKPWIPAGDSPEIPSSSPSEPVFRKGDISMERFPVEVFMVLPETGRHHEET